MTLLGAGAGGSIAPVVTYTAGTDSFPDTALSFSRPSLATMFDSTGKLTYAPNNLLTYSNTFSNAAWTKQNLTVSTGVSDPLGGSNAFTLTATAANAQIWQNINGIFKSGVNIIQTIWVRRRTGSGTVNLYDPAGNNPHSLALSTSWQQFSYLSGNVANWSFVCNILFASSGDEIDVYAATGSAVTYETTPRTADQVITTSAAYYGPRIDYAPSTLAVKGLLLEGSRTNATYPSTGALSGGNWLSTNLTFPSTTVGIDGVSGTGAKAVVGIGMSAGNSYDISTAASSVGTISVYAKPAGYNYLILVRGTYLSGDWAIFDVNSGIIAQSPTFAGSTAIIRQGPNSFWYCELRSTQNTTINAFSVTSAVNNTTISNGTDGVYVAEFQTELGATFGTSRIRTSASSVTRAQDSLAAAAYSSNPAIIQYSDQATGARARKKLTTFSSISSETAEWIEAIRVYPVGTSSAYLDGHLTVDGAW